MWGRICGASSQLCDLGFIGGDVLFLRFGALTSSLAKYIALVKAASVC